MTPQQTPDETPETPEAAVARAMTSVDRRRFLPEAARARWVADRPVSIGYGQTNSQPTTVRRMLTLLDVRPGQHVLDVGTGSGWTAALLAELVGPTGSVVGVERVPALAASAREAVEGAAAPVDIHDAAPGVLGVPQRGPYARILVSAEPETMPRQLIEQLDDHGILVIPVAGVMHRVVRTAAGLETTTHGGYRFVPLIEDPQV